MMEGRTPAMVDYMEGMGASAAIAAAGGTLTEDKTLSVDGRRAKADTPVRPGSTVALQPMADNG
jgi:protein involved in polysaccharide export with SLBB domain